MKLIVSRFSFVVSRLCLGRGTQIERAEMANETLNEKRETRRSRREAGQPPAAGVSRFEILDTNGKLVVDVRSND
jgi:hypothetical protein